MLLPLCSAAPAAALLCCPAGAAPAAVATGLCMRHVLLLPRCHVLYSPQQGQAQRSQQAGAQQQGAQTAGSSRRQGGGRIGMSSQIYTIEGTIINTFHSVHDHD